MSRSHFSSLLKAACWFGVLLMGGRSLLAQTMLPPVTTFIGNIESGLTNLATSFGEPAHRVIFGGNLVFANGAAIAKVPVPLLLDYADGLKAAGAQRIELNPGVTSPVDPSQKPKYDALIKHIRQLGLRLAINAEFDTGEMKVTTFQDFQNEALQTYPQLAALYQPDNFVVIHEPTTASARMYLKTTVQDWHNFILAVTPLIKKASPHTRVGAGAYQGTTTPALSQQEGDFFQDIVHNIPACSADTISSGCLDFVTMDIYNADTFDTYQQWAQAARAAGKGVYIEETWAPAYVPYPLPDQYINSLGYLNTSLDQIADPGPASSVFKQLDIDWLHAMGLFAAANDMESVTAFTTQTFFAYGGSSGSNTKPTNSAYAPLAQTAMQQGQLTATASAFLTDTQQSGISVVTSISNASYATLPSIFNPSCGTATNPCNAQAVVAPDSLVSAFGANLATATGVTTSFDFPTNLAGTTMTLVDSSNTTYQVPMYSVSPQQVNYYVPGNAQPGPATITVASAGGTQTTGIILISAVSPGLYTANQSGKGVPAAIAVCAGTCAGWPTTGHANGQFFQYTFVSGCAPGSCEPQPISLGVPADNVVIEFFGTGLRHLASLTTITAQVTDQQNNRQSVPVQYAGKAGYTGLDQVNVQLPHTLAGIGQVSLVLTVQAPDGSTVSSNPVALNIQ